MRERATVAVEKLNTKMVVLNNQVLGMVFQWENTFYRKNHAHSILSHPELPDEMYPDFVKIAEGYGIPAARVFTEAEMVSAYERMLRTPGPFLIDVVVSDNHVYPMIPAGKGFADILHKDPDDERVECDPVDEACEAEEEVKGEHPDVYGQSSEKKVDEKSAGNKDVYPTRR